MFYTHTHTQSIMRKEEVHWVKSASSDDLHERRSEA